MLQQAALVKVAATAALLAITTATAPVTPTTVTVTITVTVTATAMATVPNTKKRLLPSIRSPRKQRGEDKNLHFHQITPSTCHHYLLEPKDIAIAVTDFKDPVQNMASELPTTAKVKASLGKTSPPQGSAKGRGEGEGARERAREKKLECTQSCGPGECSHYKKLSDIIRFF